MQVYLDYDNPMDQGHSLNLDRLQFTLFREYKGQNNCLLYAINRIRENHVEEEVEPNGSKKKKVCDQSPKLKQINTKRLFTFFEKTYILSYK